MPGTLMQMMRSTFRIGNRDVNFRTDLAQYAELLLFKGDYFKQNSLDLFHICISNNISHGIKNLSAGFLTFASYRTESIRYLALLNKSGSV